MPVIIPPTWVYINLNRDCGGSDYGYARGDNGSAAPGCAVLVAMLIVISYFVCVMYKDSPSKIYEKELKYGTEKILAAAHTDAVNSVNTINIDEYEFGSAMAAKLDSAYYARKITMFIKRSGTEFLVWKPDVTKKVYVLTVDENRIAKDAKFLKLSNGYKRAVEQLAVQRRISKQK